jgi:hypothetical protein
MKSYMSIFCGITPCSSQKVKAFLDACIVLVCCFAYSSVLKMEATCVPPKNRLTFSGLYGVIAQKIELCSSNISVCIRRQVGKEIVIG